MKLIALTAVLLSTYIAFADEQKSPGLDPNCRAMCYRMGDRITSIGTIQAGPVHNATQSLMKVPADDSNKFHGAILVSDHPAYKAGCDRLLHDINTEEQLLAWFKLDDLRKSWFLPQVRRFEDPTQKAWFDGIRKELFPVDAEGKATPIKDADGKAVPPFPAIVVKPPLNGRYGDNEQVVTIIFGYNGDVAGTCERIQKAVDEWMQSHDSTGLMHAAVGPSVEGRQVQQDWALPYQPQPAPPIVEFDPSAQGQLPKRFNEPAKPKLLTAKQIKELLPDAPRDFRIQMLEEEASDPVKVKEAWLAHREAALKARIDNLPTVSHDDTQTEQVAGNEEVDKISLNPTKPTQGKVEESSKAITLSPWDGAGLMFLGTVITLASVYLYQRHQQKRANPAAPTG